MSPCPPDTNSGLFHRSLCTKCSGKRLEVSTKETTKETYNMEKRPFKELTHKRDLPYEKRPIKELSRKTKQNGNLVLFWRGGVGGGEGGLPYI